MAWFSNSANRQPEKWFKRFLWLIAFIFAGFLIGLGGKVVGDLPKVNSEKTVADYADPIRYPEVEQNLKQVEQRLQHIQQNIDQQNLALTRQQEETANAQKRFENWLATRSATEQSSQNPQVIAQTQALDQLKQKEQIIEQKINDYHQDYYQTELKLNQLTQEREALEEVAYQQKYKDDQRIELQVFLYRLALTLPLLILAVYLFMKHRHSRWWPFVWGFNFFAIFAFFVELVPYLPSYGGYVRYIVGIIFTLVIGRYVIIAMQRYIERKQAEEAMPSEQRQLHIDYDAVQKSFAKSTCPSCERGLDLNLENLDYCPHCGIQLFNYCQQCEARKNAFVHYCSCCGTASEHTVHQK